MFSLAALPLARVELLAGPTPVEDLGGGLWVKREDLAGGLYGGNKVRKLEYLLGDALELGGDVLTLGAVGSHHVLATAVYGKQVGVRVHAVVFPQRDSAHARANARAIHAWVEQLWVARSSAEIPLVWAKAELGLRTFGGFRPVTIPLGGSNALGTIAWAGAGLEIAAQVKRGDLPLPERVVVPLGSGGTAAGLVVGLRMAGLATEVVGVRVVPSTVGNRAVVHALARRAATRLRRLGAPHVRFGGFTLVDRQYGDGYARPTPASERAAAVAAERGLALDPTYASKAFAEVLATPGRPTLFIDTVSSKPMAPLLRSALDEVPDSLAGLLS